MEIVFNSPLHFIDSFNQTKKAILKAISENLEAYQNPKLKDYKSHKLDTGGTLKIIQFKDLNNWDVKTHSAALKALAKKINRLAFDVGDPQSIVPMLKSILKGTKTVKTLKGTPNKKGHFYIDYTVYTLNPSELEYLKKVLKNYGLDLEV